MCRKTKLRKIAWVLLLVAMISLIPTSTFKVLADEAIVPPFPFDELQTIGDGNSYALFRVHGIDQVDYVEVIAPDANLHGMYQHLLPGLSYSGLGGWVLQINSIAYCFKNGQKVDFDLQSLFTSSFLPVENDDPYFSCWLEFVYTTEDIYGIDDDANNYTGYGTRFFKAQNFYIEPAATPTPTPMPLPDSPIPYNDLIDGSDLLFLFKVIDENNIYYNQYIGLKMENIKTWLLNGGEIYLPYYTTTNQQTLILDNCITFPRLNAGNPAYYFWRFGEDLPEFDDLNSPIDSVSFQPIFQNTLGYDYSLPYYSYPLLAGHALFFQGSTVFSDTTRTLFEIIAFNHDYESNLNINFEGSSAIPTPTTAPTAIPQPSTTPEPEDPDKNSSWGWGIVNALKYIFIPDKNKLIRLEKTTQTKFQQFGGGYDDLKHVSGFVDPVRPQNVVMNWHPVGSDSVEEQQQITLVDFEQIDFYLFQTSSGMFICECLKASFTFLMFGYLIHVIRKHFVIENNSSDENDGGGD